jgi:hypothetical protein
MSGMSGFGGENGNRKLDLKVTVLTFSRRALIWINEGCSVRFSLYHSVCASPAAVLLKRQEMNIILSTLA